jgi:hypothetical protein
MEKQIYRIENWTLSDTVFVLWGNVYDNPRFKDGAFIHTSELQGWDAENKVVITRNSKYILGEPMADYEKQFPDAKNRLIAVLEKFKNED